MLSMGNTKSKRKKAKQSQPSIKTKVKFTKQHTKQSQPSTAYDYDTLPHKLDIDDFTLMENVRDILSDIKRDKSYDNNKNNMTEYVYFKLNTGKSSADRQRISYILTEIQKQDGTGTSDTLSRSRSNSLKTTKSFKDQNYLKVTEQKAWDELTPSQYAKKQKELTNTTEYKKITYDYRLTMSKLLTNQTKKTLEKQCLNENCPGTSDHLIMRCGCVQRIDCILSVYNQLMHCEMLWKSVPFGPILIFKDLYGHQQIYNDFLHVKMYHIDTNRKKKLRPQRGSQESKIKYHNIAKTLCEEFEKKYKCYDIGKCEAFKRHYRDRDNVAAEKEMFHLIDNNDNKITTDRNDKDKILQEECDKLHSFFLHSTIKYDNDETVDNKALSNQLIDAIADKALGRSFSVYKGDKESKENGQNPPLKSSARRTYVGKKEDEKWLESFAFEYKNDGDESKNDGAGYRLLVQHMGIFRWQSAHGFRTGQNRGLVHLRPIYKNVKEEALYNSYRRASKDNWNQTLRKSKIFYQSFARKKIKTLYPGNFKDDVSATHITWRAGEEITMTEVVMLKLYTDFDKLQHELKKCFRWETINITQQNDEKVEEMEQIQQEKQDNAKKQELEKRLCEFFHWRLGLLIVLNKYGKKINQENMVLYHGVNAKMMLHPHETMAFYGPLSTTASYHVAKTFATAKGMVLKITSQYPRLDFCRAFDASAISDYPEEQEYLIGFVYMRVLEIRTRPIINDIKNKKMWDKAPLASKIRVVFFAIHLFREQMFSMSQHLEYYLIEFLKCNQMECCQTYDENSATVEIKQSFLSFLCCEVAEHQKALTGHADWSKCDKRRTRIMKILWKKFNVFRRAPNLKQIIKIDQISDGLKPFFLEKLWKKDIHKNIKYGVSFKRLLEIFPNVKEVHYINDYRFGNRTLKQLLEVLANNQMYGQPLPKSPAPVTIAKSVTEGTPPPQHSGLPAFAHFAAQQSDPAAGIWVSSLNKISFLYYDYADAKDPQTGDTLGHPEEGDKFCHPDGLKQELKNDLKSHGWDIFFDFTGEKGKTGCKIRICKQEQTMSYTTFVRRRSTKNVLPGPGLYK